jgi:hypothetical protein
MDRKDVVILKKILEEIKYLEDLVKHITAKEKVDKV